MATILCVDDDPAVGRALEATVRYLGHEARTARGAAEALRALEDGRVDLILSDFQMPGIDGVELLSMLRHDGIDAPVILLTGHGSIEHAVAAMKAGALDYLTKPIEREALEHAIGQAVRLIELRRENEALRREVGELRSTRRLLGDGPAMRRVLQTIATAAPTRATVLVQGESGTGKELVAHALHEQSDRGGEAFVKINCAALPEGLVESALFGHERGAFTGATRRVPGAFERAHRGTLLLDEISEMRLDLQAKLLRVLQEQEFERVGGTAPIRVDVRIVATTNRDLAAEVQLGRFRQDLFFRLNVLRIHLPPLRERREDIPLLAQHFAQRAAAQMGRTAIALAPDAAALLAGHSWPGNVRELQHAVERAVILCRGEELGAPLFPDLIAAGGQAGATALAGAALPPAEGDAEGDRAPGRETVVLRTLNIDEAEKALIERALAVTHNNRTRAAELLGITVRTLRNKLNGPGGRRLAASGPGVHSRA